MITNSFNPLIVFSKRLMNDDCGVSCLCSVCSIIHSLCLVPHSLNSSG
jgi:hypothetical protein